jgi:hypothetical protein
MSAHPYPDRHFSAKYERYALQDESCARERTSLTVRVHDGAHENMRHMLQAMLPAGVGIYVMHVDRRRGITTLQLQARRADLDDVMATIMRAIPRAEFGVVLDSRLAAVH